MSETNRRRLSTKIAGLRVKSEPRNTKPRAPLVNDSLTSRIRSSWKTSPTTRPIAIAPSDNTASGSTLRCRSMASTPPAAGNTAETAKASTVLIPRFESTQ